jgi:alpha-beta hydrolase superfamily lysophospholipase
MSASIEEMLREATTDKLHFESCEMDFYLKWFLGYAAYGGAQLGECMRVAHRIREDDPESWVREWSAMARHLEARALKSLDCGHLVSARESYMRASTYYRAALVFARPSEPRFMDIWEDMRTCFRVAAALFQPAINHVDIPFEGGVLPGYFVRVDDSGTPRPLLIAVGGGEMFAEELYYWAAAAGQRRGYNVLMVEMPGQGSTPLQGLYFQVDTEQPVRAVVRYAVGRPEVDRDKIAVFGTCGGGYAVARGVAREKRVKACVLNPPITDVRHLMEAEMPPVFVKGPCSPGEQFVMVGEQRHPLAEILLDKMCWQSGVSRPAEAMELARAAHLGPIVRDIECPVLCMVSEGESREQNAQARGFFEELQVPRQLRVFTYDEGAGAHCQIDNLGLMHSVMFDWLDELFGYDPALV